MRAHYRRLSVVDIRPLVKAFRQIPGNEVGGNLHIYLDDENVQDDHIKFCLDCAVNEGDLLGEAICRLSLKMSITQRKKLSREYHDD